MAVFFGFLAIVLAVLLIVIAAFLSQAKTDLRTEQQMSVQSKQQFDSSLVRYRGISDLEKHQADLRKKLEVARAVLPKFEKLSELERHKSQLITKLAEYEQLDNGWQKRISSHESRLADLTSQTESVEEALDIQSFGFYRPKYGFEDSERYSHELKKTRNIQKQMVRSGEATHCPQQWTVDGSVSQGRKMIKEQAKLMLRAFNGECDAAVSKVKYNNANSLETRINRSFESINKLGESKQLWITHEYLSVKLQELYLVHEHREKSQEEREEQRRIKDQMREEDKALREIEKAKKESEQEEKTKTKALEKARDELAAAHGQQTNRLKEIVDRLEAELKGALERKAKAIARAQLTRSGHIYVISNIGSFGEGIYKVGMTRRLEPLERVKELGDASVPFKFDVHAMIYSEDAPALENAMHKEFELRRVNRVNSRREFFKITLEEIREAVEKHFGIITFVTVPEAEEYRKSLSMQEAISSPEQNGSAPPNATQLLSTSRSSS